MRRFLFSLIFCCFLPVFSRAQDADSLRVGVRGFLDSYHAVRTDEPFDWMSSRTRLRAELSLSKGPASAFLSANLVHNALLPDRSGLFLREAYASFSSGSWDLRVGRQIIAWGVADGLRLTDVVSPMDYTEFLAQDYDDIRVPVGALRLRYSFGSWCLEALAVPSSSFFVLPTDSLNPWSVGPVAIEPEPEPHLRNIEYGGRLSCFLNGADFSFSALRTWNKMPVLFNGVGVFRRMTMLGADLSLPLGPFVLRSEAAAYLDEAQPAMGLTEVPRATSVNLLAALDWYPGCDWTFSVQYAHKYVAWGDHRNSGLATLRVSKELLHNSLTLQDFAYIDVTNGGIFNRLSADYALNDQLHALIGYDLFHASRGSFAIYNRNSQLWLKVKYSF